MIQRALIATCLIITLASLSLVGLVWHQSNHAAKVATLATRQLAETQAANQAKTVELLAHSQATSAEMLKQLQTMATALQSPRSPEWVPVKFTLRLERPDGPPAVGYQVTLGTGSTILTAQGINRESDSAGLVDFGVVHPGDWVFKIERTRDDQHTWVCRGSINVLPGVSVAKTIVCPGPLPAQSPVKLHVEWPADLADKDLRMAVTFVQAPTTFQPSLMWRAIDKSDVDRHCSVFFGPGLKQTEVGGKTSFEFWTSYAEWGPNVVGRVFGDLRSQNVRTESDSVVMQLGNFLPRQLVIMRPRVRQKATSKGERFDVLAHTVESDENAWRVSTYSTNPDDEGGAYGGQLIVKNLKGCVTVAPSYWRQLEGHFWARSGQVNDWTLPLPEELIDMTRKRLAEKDDPLPEAPALPSTVVLP